MKKKRKKNAKLTKCTTAFNTKIVNLWIKVCSEKADARIGFSLTAIFSSVTQTQTRTQLARVWLEYESSGIKLSVSGV